LGLSPKIRERVKIVKAGIDTQTFSPLNDGSTLRVKLGFDDSDIVLLFVGALGKYCRYKGVDYLIKAAHLARKRNSSVKLVVVGGGELVSELKQLAQELNLEEDIIFTGAVPNEQLPSYYAMCDIFVLPSISGPESFGIVVVEAMASGKPAIVSDLPGVRDVIKNEETGLKVPPKDTQALSQAILRLIEDDDLRSRMAQNARKEVESLSWQRCAREMDAIYKELAI
jgi:glycosyltransferase involved in cell wall biosynthesis